MRIELPAHCRADTRDGSRRRRPDTRTDQAWCKVAAVNQGLYRSREARKADRRKRIQMVIKLWNDGVRSDTILGRIIGVGGETIRQYRTAAGLYYRKPYANSPVKDKAREEYSKPQAHDVVLNAHPALSTLVGKERKCLKCGSRMWSSHAGERVCGPCKGGRMWRSGGNDLSFRT
jgi:hypothetical protein